MSGTKVIMLQASGTCYSWRLPPLRWLGDCDAVEARKETVWCSEVDLFGDLVLIPVEERRRATLGEERCGECQLIGWLKSSAHVRAYIPRGVV
jgi:hypothetical protein